MIADIVGGKTIRDVWDETAAECGEKIFMTYVDCDQHIQENFTYGEFNQRINQAANFFIDLGIKKGDMVGVQMYTNAEFLITWFGLAKIGAVMVPANVQYKTFECEYIINKCHVKNVVIEEEFLSIYNNKEVFPGMKNIVVARGSKDHEGVHNFGLELDKQPVELKEVRPISSDDLFEILFTSGTTSLPKGSMITHANAVYAGIFHSWQCGMTHEDKLLTVMPGFHIDFQIIACFPVITMGATLVIESRYSAKRFWSEVVKHEITITEAIPMIVRTMMMQPVQSWEKKHKVKQIYFSLCLSTEEKYAFEERFNVRLLNCYGLTESVCCTTADPVFGERRWPSVGKAAMSFEIKIADEAGNPLPAKEIGEICMKGVPGRTMIKGYYNDQEATDKLIKPGGWLHSGDRGYMDEDGWLYFVDRKVNMIKRSGENVSSSEVENVFTSHPSIHEAAVIGVDDPIREQLVKAFVSFVEGETLTAEEIEAYCCARLATFKVPTIVEVVDDFPRTCTGKIQKKYLK